MTLAAPEDIAGLEAKVKEMYRAVAENPQGTYHFEMGRHWRRVSGIRPRCST